MSNETTQSELLSKVDETITYIHGSILTVENVEDVKELISELQNEVLIDNVLYGDEFEMVEKKFNELDDERINIDNIDVETFLKPKFAFNKETKVYSEVKPIPCVRIVSGYHDEYKVSEYEFFANVYNGDDKETFKDIISKKTVSDNSLSASRASLLKAIDSDIKKDITSAKKLASDQFEINVIVVREYNELMQSVPHVTSALRTKSEDTTATLRLKHTKFQDVCKNRISVLRTALKQSDVIKSTKELEALKTRNIKMSTLWNRLQPDHKRFDVPE
jgi:hypothetical protein